VIAVVTGSSGFIGSHLVDALRARGDDVRSLRVRADEPIARSELGGADIVYHVGGLTSAPRATDLERANARCTAQLAAACPDRTRFVYVSSQAAAGPARSLDRPVVESDEPRPVEAYGRSKLEAERAVLAEASRLRVAIVRPGAVYGARDRDFLRIFRLLQRGLGVYPGIRDAWVSLIHVDDLVEGILRLPAEGGFFLANPEPVKWRDVYALIAGVVDRTPYLELDLPFWVLRPTAGLVSSQLLNRHRIALSRPRYWVCSSEHASRTFGFHPRVALADGFRDTAAAYRKAGWL
jgi:nucleoside-diphosphate-sugar epimerase